MSEAQWAGVFAVFLALMFAGAIVGKTREIRRRGVSVVATGMPGPPPLRPYLMAVAIGAELVAAVTLFMAPIGGLWLSFALFLVYIVYIALVPDGEPCYCFGQSLELGKRRTLRLARNGLLTTVTLIALVLGHRSGVSLDMVALGAAVLAVFLVFSADALFRSARKLSEIDLRAGMSAGERGGGDG